MENRLKVIETTIERHDAQINKLFSRVDGISKNLACIQKTIDQVKYLALGGFAFFIISEMGLLAALKLTV